MIPTLQDAVASAPPASSRGAVVASFIGVTRLGQTVGPVLAGAGLAAVGSEAVFLTGAVLAVAMGSTVLLLGRRGVPPQGEEIAATPANPVP
jgi:predicted MFS family arabinose efflux permease